MIQSKVPVTCNGFVLVQFQADSIPHLFPLANSSQHFAFLEFVFFFLRAQHLQRVLQHRDLCRNIKACAPQDAGSLFFTLQARRKLFVLPLNAACLGLLGGGLEKKPFEMNTKRLWLTQFTLTSLQPSKQQQLSLAIVLGL